VSLHTLDIKHLICLKKIRKLFTSIYVLDFRIDTAFTPPIPLTEGTSLSLRVHVCVVAPCHINRQFVSYPPELPPLAAPELRLAGGN